MELPETEIHLWYADQADFQFDALRLRCFDWLNNEDQRRLERYQFDRHKMQLLLSRYLLRCVLSQYRPAIDPGAWQFDSNDYGKPSISAQMNTHELFFNLSHSADKVVLAVSKFEGVGVDIENNCKDRRVERIAGRYFSAREQHALLDLDKDDRLARFYALWTLKEAYIKACGLGLAIPLDQFSYGFPGSEKLLLEFSAQRNDQPNDWQLWRLQIAGDYDCALAVKSGSEAPVKSLRSWQLGVSEGFQSLPTQITASNQA